MKNYGFILISLFCSGHSLAQLQDNFSDGNLSNPDWSGSASQFIINASGQLQLNNSVAGSSFLAVANVVSLLVDYEWQVYIKQSFSPSGSNYGRVYLMSDQSDLTQPLNGYYLQFGEAGSNDAVQLFEQSGSVSTSVCRGTNGKVASSFSLRIKVLRNQSGLWELWIDYSGGTNVALEASGTNQNHLNGSFFGFSCVYTSSNATKFYYDDVSAGPLTTDHSPPELESIQVLSANSLAIHFSESLDPQIAESTVHYAVDNGLGNPQIATLQPDNSSVNVSFATNFPNGIQNQMTVSGVADLAGNSLTHAQLSFYFLQPAPTQKKDVIINEIFPDPVPQLGLPNAEFIVLYNRSANPIDLKGWKVSDGTSTAIFPTHIILPQQYQIVTSTTSSSEFSAFGNVIGLSGFPTLNNGGDTLVLKSPEGVTIDSLSYTLGWYRDSDKEVGGWTLELIDPNNPCGEEGNWTSSNDPGGGTPGRQNSVFANQPDLTGPVLLTVVPVLTNSLLLMFDEKLESSAAATGSFSLTPVIPISNSYFTDWSLRQIQLELFTALQFGQLYTLKVEQIQDCNKNWIQDEYNQIEFALPEPADSLDVLVNEILFNPRPNGTDFVEVYNTSHKYINLKNWKLANTENGFLKNVLEITSGDFILGPGAYLVFTADPVLLMNNYPKGQEKSFLNTDLPGLPDDEGSIALVNSAGKIIDYFFYNKDFHSDLIKDEEGVSLERISFSNPTNDHQNWKSASSVAGFATPGYLNSNARPENPVAAGSITVEPEIFIPNSGMQDFAMINYRFEQPGYVANIKVLDQQGHLIKVVSNNETLGYEGFFRWDGDRDDGSKARIGYYAVWVEVFDLSGTVSTFRKRVVIATK